MSFTIETTAKELMLEPDELKEIFEAFFEDAVDVMAQAEQAVKEDDMKAFAKRMHSLKGSALNLRMEVIGEIARKAEKEAPAGRAEREGILRDLQQEIEAARQVVTAYYQK